MITARLEAIEKVSRHRLCYAEARCSDGRLITGLGFAGPGDPTGKYDALWDLAQHLGDIEVVDLPPRKPLTTEDSRAMAGWDAGCPRTASDFDR